MGIFTICMVQLFYNKRLAILAGQGCRKHLLVAGGGGSIKFEGTFLIYGRATRVTVYLIPKSNSFSNQGKLR